MARGEKTSRAESFEQLRTDYQAAKRSRFKRRRTGTAAMGSGADYHYRLESDFLRIMEYARDMDRNDAIVGQMVDRAVQNIVQEGLTPDPKTGDSGLDQAIKDRWWEWAGVAVTDPEKAGGQSLCSADGELVYRDLEKLVLRSMFVDGDNFTLHLEDGTMQVCEAHRCRSPLRTTRSVHGVVLDDKRKRVEYWFTKDEIDPMQVVARLSDIEARPAFDANGQRTVLHLRNPKRVTQTRGVSAFAPVFDMLGFHEDLQFAKLVQQQVASCVAILRNRGSDWKAGAIDPYGTQTVYDAQQRIVEELTPGMEIRGLPGEEIKGFSPNIPNSEFFEQMRSILQLIGINLGLPLVLLLMDASDTNFSGWRGAMDTARMGFRDMQRHLIDQWETPNYLWKVRDFAATDAAMRTALASRTGKVKLFAHEWQAPRWAYIQPYQDAQAVDLRQRKLMISPRRARMEEGGDHTETIKEIVEDNSLAIKTAAEAAKALSAQVGEKISWREMLFLTDEGMFKAVTAAAPPPAPPASGQNDKPQNAVQEFLQKLVLQLAGNSLTAPLIANALKLGMPGGVVETAGAPINPGYDEPLLPVQVPPGQAQVTGAVVKDRDGSVVGGSIEQPETPETPAGADGEVATTEDTKPTDGEAPPKGGTTNGPPKGGTPSDGGDDAGA